ncbi:MAG: MerC domain-containing protein [Panacagrimonas sp.]
MRSRATRRKPRADHAAICLSGLCVLHCLMLPLLIALLPALSVLDHYESWIHRGLLLLVLPISAWALGSGCARHGHRAILIAGVVALTVLAIAPFLGRPDWELPLTVVGSLALIASHLLNLRRLQGCKMAFDGHA